MSRAEVEPLRRHRRPHQRAVRRCDHRQRDAARHRLPGRRDPGHRRAPGEGDRAERGRRAAQRRRVPLGAAVGGGARCRRGSGRTVGRGQPGRDDRRADRAPGRRPGRLPVEAVRQAVPRGRGAGAGRRGEARFVACAHRSGRPQPLQADGLQGRVRGGAPLPAARVDRRRRGRRRQGRDDPLPPAPADAAVDGDAAQGQAPPLGRSGVPDAAWHEAAPGSLVRPVRSRRSAPRRTGDDPGVHRCGRRPG